MFVETGYHQEAQVKADPFQLETLIGWLETKDPNESYAYLDQGNCCLAQYFKEKAPEYTKVSSMYVEGPRVAPYRLPRGFNSCAKGPYDNTALLNMSHKDRKSTTPEWTFGKALERAKQYAAV